MVGVMVSDSGGLHNETNQCSNGRERALQEAKDVFDREGI